VLQKISRANNPEATLNKSQMFDIYEGALRNCSDGGRISSLFFSL